MPRFGFTCPQLGMAAGAPTRGLRGEGEIPIVVLDRGCLFVQHLIDDGAQRRQGAHRVGIGRVAGEGKRLAAATTEVDRLAWTAPARLLHPVIAAERVERRGLRPNPLKRAVSYVVERERRDVGGSVARQGPTVRRPEQGMLPPAPVGWLRGLP